MRMSYAHVTDSPEPLERRAFMEHIALCLPIFPTTLSQVPPFFMYFDSFPSSLGILQSLYHIYFVQTPPTSISLIFVSIDTDNESDVAATIALNFDFIVFI